MQEMHSTAQGIASLGRGDDSVLVHMTPGEVGGLQSLAKAHGGSLTINPHTGLPEAGFLSSLLPAAIGLGVSAMSGGTLTPSMSALLAGGLTAGLTGNLQKGLLAGIGSYGMSGIGESLAGAGADAATSQAVSTPAFNAQAAELANSALTPPTPVPAMPPPDVANAAGASSGWDVPRITPEQYAQKMGSASAATTQTAGAQAPFQDVPVTDAAMAARNPTMFGSQRMGDIAAGAQQEGALKKAFMSKNGLMAGMGLVPLATDMMSSGNSSMPSGYAPGASGYAPMSAYDKRYTPGAYNPMGENTFFPGDRYARGMAEGGVAEGGIAALGTYKAGGLLDGPGDGVSDSIPAVINGAKPQRAALADGEFVVPARVVSEIGNGSTKAGSKRLYAMLDRIEKARKRVKNGGDSGAHRMLPA